MSHLFGFISILLLSWSKSERIVEEQQDLFRLPIVHFNDFHARFEETSLSSTKCGPESEECIGGFARLYTVINDLKTENPDAVVLFAGDAFQGTLWYDVFRWNVTQHFMNMLPIDAHTLGNHEFDHGINGIIPYLITLKAPVVVSNIDDSLEPDIQGMYKKSIVIERKGRKIGIIGTIATETKDLSDTGDLIFISDMVAVRNEAKKLKEQGVNIIIILSHCGIDADKLIAKNAGEHIDIIVGGHSHSLLYTGQPPLGDAVDVYPIVVQHLTNKNILIVQASSHTKYVGNISAYFDPQGNLVSWQGSPIYLNKSIVQDKNIIEQLKPFKEEIDAIGKQEIGISKVLLSKSKCSSGECNIGNFIADAFVQSLVVHADVGYWTNASICIFNQNSIKASINKGSITYEDLLIAHPFLNPIQTFDLQGKYIVEALEHSVDSTSNSTKFSSRLMLQVSGLQIVFNISKPIGRRVEKVLVRCAKCDIPSYFPIQPETIYRVVSTSFIANGHLGFGAISQNKKNVIIWESVRNVLEAHIKKFSPIISGEDNRIIITT